MAAGTLVRASGLRGRVARRGSDLPIAHPARMVEWYAGREVPDIIEFVVSDKYLNRPRLYPRQATILKTIFLRDDLFTDYDYDVLGNWASSFEHTGQNGVSPDIFERIGILKSQGWPYFHEVVAPIGRRGSKGHMGALSCAYVLWSFLAKGDPQGHYGIDRDKRLSAAVYAGRKEQARDNQWRDLNNVVTGAPCFTEYIAQSMAESLSIYAPHDFARMWELAERGIESGVDLASFIIQPLPSTLQAGRGPTNFVEVFDEMAHVIATGANRSAEEVYEASKPALDQFKKDGFIFEGSSPWQQTGKFYENYQRALAVEDGLPVDPQMLVLQLTSWDPYVDWQRAHQIPLVPGESTKVRTFIPLQLAFQEPPETDEQMRREEAANPETFSVERRAHFASVQDAYLRRDFIERMFRPWPEGRVLRMQERGVMALLYKGHGDPSKSQANFGFAIAHTEDEVVQTVDSAGRPKTEVFKHCVFDVIHVWRPSDFPTPEGMSHPIVDYNVIEDEIFDYAKRFLPAEITFDQYDSASPIAKLNKRVRDEKDSFPKRVTFSERTANATLNWRKAETFKTALGMDWVHAPYWDENGNAYEASELVELELRFLQEKNGKVIKQDTGPVTTKDVADCLMECVHHLIGEQVSTFLGQSLGKMEPRMSVQGGAPQSPEIQAQQAEMGGLNPFASQLSDLGKTRSDRGGNFSPARGGRLDRHTGMPRRRGLPRGRS